MTATRVRRVDEVAVVFNGKTPSKSEQRDSGHPVLKIKDVDALGRFQGTYSGHVDVDFARKHVKRQLAGGETLVLNAAHSATHVASKTFYAAQEVAGSLATGEWLIVRWNTDTVDSRFGNHWINAPDTRFRIRRLVNGIHLYPKDVARLQIPLPPLAEQKRIADILDKADALRAKRRTALAQLGILTRSIFLDMFGDPAASGWCMTTIDGVAAETKGAIRTGPFGSQLLHSEFTEEGIAVLGIDNVVENEFRWGQRRFISEGKYRQLSRYTVHAGDVLVTIMGTCGRCAIVPDDIPQAVSTKHLCCITLNRTKCLPVFLHAYFLQHPIARHYLAQKAKGAIMAGLNMRILREMPIPRAPIDLQKEFAEIVKAVDRVKRVQRQAEAEFEALLASLQHRAFRGEL